MVTLTSDGHTKVLWFAQKSDGMLPIGTPKSDGDGITTFVTSRHDAVRVNDVQGIQNQQDCSVRLFGRSTGTF